MASETPNRRGERSVRSVIAALFAIACPFGCSIYDGTPGRDPAPDGATTTGAGTGGSAGMGGTGGSGAGGASGAASTGGASGAASTGGAAGRSAQDATSDAVLRDASDVRGDASSDPAFVDASDVTSSETGTDGPGDNQDDANDASDASVDGLPPPSDASFDVGDTNPAVDADASTTADTGASDAPCDGGPPTGVTYKLVAQHSNKCVDVYHNLTADGTA